MAQIAPLTEAQNRALGTLIRDNLFGQIRPIIAPFTPEQINNRRYELRINNEMAFITALEFAYNASKGPNGAKTVKEILKKNPTFSARILLTPAQTDMITASDIFAYHVVGEAGHPIGGIEIADLTAEEKGKLIVTLALRYPSNVYGYGPGRHYPSDASVLVQKLLETEPPVEAKYINAALYYVTKALPRKSEGPGNYDLVTTNFQEVLTGIGAGVVVVPANINQGLLGANVPNQATFKTKREALNAKEARKLAKEAERAAKIASWRANIGPNIPKILKEGVLFPELVEYLNTPEGLPKLKEKNCKFTGIEGTMTILECAILNDYHTLVDALLDMPDLLTKMDKDSNIVLHILQLHRNLAVLTPFKKYVESVLFTIADLPMDALYELLDVAVVEYRFLTLFNKIIAEKGVNTVNPGGDDEADPTKLDIYYVYYNSLEVLVQNTYKTLYQKIISIPYMTLFPDLVSMKETIEGLHGNIAAKTEAAIAKKRLTTSTFVMPPPGPLRDGDPATEERAFAAAHAHPILWKGFSDSDALTLKDIFKPDKVVNAGRIERPSIDAGFCPVCLAFIPHGRECIYMTHECNPNDIINKTLHNKYKTPGTGGKFKISWCTVCNRPCNSHRHYKVSNIFGPKPENAPFIQGDIFGTECTPFGGGGFLEKVGRFDALRKEAKALLPSIGTISHKEARLRLAKAFWNAPITDYRASATALLAAAGWENDPFPTIDEGAPATYANVPYTRGILLDGELTNVVLAEENLQPGDVLLPEVRHEDIEAINSLEIANPVIRYRHRKPDNAISLHVGEYYSIVGIFNSLASRDTTAAEAGGTFGQCPTCTAILHPDEIKYILDEILFDVDEWDKYNKAYIEYTKNYNRVINIRMTAVTANAGVLDGGGNNNNAIEDESGPVSKHTFPKMENEECAILPKTNGGKRPHTIKQIKLRRRVTRIRPIYVVKKQSRTRRHSSTRRKVRR